MLEEYEFPPQKLEDTCRPVDPEHKTRGYQAHPIPRTIDITDLPLFGAKFEPTNLFIHYLKLKILAEAEDSRSWILDKFYSRTLNFYNRYKEPTMYVVKVEHPYQIVLDGRGIRLALWSLCKLNCEAAKQHLYDSLVQKGGQQQYIGPFSTEQEGVKYINLNKNGKFKNMDLSVVKLDSGLI